MDLHKGYPFSSTPQRAAGPTTQTGLTEMLGDLPSDLQRKPPGTFMLGGFPSGADRGGICSDNLLDAGPPCALLWCSMLRSRSPLVCAIPRKCRHRTLQRYCYGRRASGQFTPCACATRAAPSDGIAVLTRPSSRTAKISAKPPGGVERPFKNWNLSVAYARWRAGHDLKQTYPSQDADLFAYA